MSKKSDAALVDALRKSEGPFTLGDWDEKNWLEKKMSVLQIKWQNWVTEVANKIYYDLKARPYFRMQYRTRFNPMQSIDPMAAVEVASFERSEFEDARGDLDYNKIYKRAEAFCTKQMEITS